MGTLGAHKALERDIAVSSAKGRIVGRIYPGSFDLELEKKISGRRIQVNK
jgi:hypothetical protein